MNTQHIQRIRRHRRVRSRIQGTARRPRLSVFRSHAETYAQLVDDVAGSTLASVRTSKLSAKDLKHKKPVEAAFEVGREIAQQAKAQNITSAVFDRGGYAYHGRVKAVAEGARSEGLTI